MTTPTSISLFSPATARSPDDCETYYVRAHTRWARRMLREDPAYQAYHTARAITRFADGAFAAEPTRWRYVLLQRRPDRAPRFSADTEAYIAEDHRHFLQDWHGFAAEQTVLFDARAGQTTFECYLLEIAATDRWREVLTGLLGHTADAYGPRPCRTTSNSAAASTKRRAWRPTLTAQLDEPRRRGKHANYTHGQDDEWPPSTKGRTP